MPARLRKGCSREIVRWLDNAVEVAAMRKMVPNLVDFWCVAIELREEKKEERLERFQTATETISRLTAVGH